MRLIWIWMVIAACHGGGADKAPPGKRIQITYDIDLDKVVDDRATDVKRELYVQLAEEKLDARVTTPMEALGVVVITPADPAKREELTALVAKTYRDTLAAHACADDRAVCFAIADPLSLRKAALERAAATIRARLVASGVDGTNVTTRGMQLVVDLPAVGPDDLLRLRSIIARTAALEFDVVDSGSPFMKQLYARAGTGDTAVQGDVDQWQLDDGTRMTDYYLRANDRAAIETYVRDLARTDPSFRLPDTRRLVFERVAPPADAKKVRPYWRSYLVERPAALTGASVVNATASSDEYTKRPIVMLEFARNGAQLFGDLTTKITGRKLAIMLDGTVRSAPLISGPIRGGRASITLGVDATERDATELAIVLKTGALPAPLAEAPPLPGR